MHDMKPKHEHPVMDLTGFPRAWIRRDEALIVGKSADGTYVLEYVDEGLIEENVPASRIRMPGGASGSSGDVGGEAAAGEDDSSVLTFTQGETVLGNFKGLGDWDEVRAVEHMRSRRSVHTCSRARAHSHTLPDRRPRLADRRSSSASTRTGRTRSSTWMRG